MSPVLPAGFIDVLYYLGALWIVTKLFKLGTARWREGTQTTPLRGPPNQGYFLGLSKYVSNPEDASDIYENWAAQYGAAYKVPLGLGSSKVVICDPKANAHFYSKETFIYVQSKLTKVLIKNILGRGLIWADGESHRRQRKALSPAFSNVAIRRLTSVFYDSAYKMKDNWDTILDSNSGDAVIDVQKWMNNISLDSIGIAGFGHDFGALHGKHPPIVEVFENFGSSDQSFISAFVVLMRPVLPILQYIPTTDNQLFSRLRVKMGEIADELLDRTRKEREGKLTAKERAEEKSIIGELIKAESTDTELQMTREEVMAQMNTLILAGYETTSISLTWTLIELARNPEKQDRLRQELDQFSGTDPTWEQLGSGLPYLDAVAHEILRIHPPVSETQRIAREDDVIPLTTPIMTSTGEMVTSITIAKGTNISSPIRAINRSETLWGPTAKEFEPKRWIESSDGTRYKEISGHRNLLTFSDGPRLCLGRHFALSEFKAVLSVLIRNYVFELVDGPTTKIVSHKGILPRPKIAGQVGAKVPMRVRRVE
ncbi:cytochrome P450 [Collybia nuda]|uniref:Cytochrome P450 n=1 Tax=Collybia nuda TaxID=64659 RepID=A0A9P5XTC7_9AGAR|nr:cytochrome P450 [Collybia nuda]